MDPRDSIDDYAPDWGSFAELFRARVDDDADFLTELDHTTETRTSWTVEQWRARVAATVDWLGAEGVVEGDCVATIAGNSADALALAFSCWVMGACVVPLNPADPVERQGFIMRDAGAVLLVHSDVHADRAATMAPVGIRRRSTSLLPTGQGFEAFSASAAAGLGAVALRIYTSGTTGDPKGVVLTAANLLTDADALRRSLDFPDDTRVLTVLPVHHVNGLIVSSLLPWVAGLSTVVCDRFRSERFWQDAAAEGATVCSVVPTLLEFLLQQGGEAAPSMRELLCGAGPLLVETALRFETQLGLPVRHIYGLSETTAVLTVMPRLEVKERTGWHREHGFPSVGPAIPHAEVTVHRPDGRVAAEGERGEIVARGAMVMQGYASQPQATATAFRDGWFHTGDEGFWKAGPHGVPYFFVAGRLKELIIRGGVNVSPYEVDAALRTHPAVDFALAIPFANRVYGEEIAAYVVANQTVSEQEIIAHCASELDFAHRPKVVIFGDDVPFTATGKAKRLELARRLAGELETYRDVQFRRSADVAARESES